MYDDNSYCDEIEDDDCILEDPQDNDNDHDSQWTDGQHSEFFDGSNSALRDGVVKILLDANLDRKVKNPRVTVTGDFGPIDSLPLGQTTKQKYSILHYASRTMPGHVYRLAFVKRATTGKLFYTCNNCHTSSRARVRPYISVYNGRFVSDPDNPRMPHFCTEDIQRCGTAPYTIGNVYADSIVAAAVEQVRTGALSGASTRQVYETAVASVDTVVPEQYREQTRAAFLPYEKVRGRMARLPKFIKEAQAQSSAEAHDQPADTHPSDNHATLTHTQHSNTGQVPGQVVHGPSAGTEPNTSQEPAGPLTGPAGERSFGTRKRRKDEQAEGTAHAQHPAPYKKSTNGRVDTTPAKSVHPTSTRVLEMVLDHDMRKSLQDDILTHQRRLLKMKEQYEQTVYSRELLQKRQMDRMNFDHMNMCNKLARRRMQLENRLVEANVLKVEAETRMMEQGKVINEVIECSQKREIHSDEEPLSS